MTWLLFGIVVWLLLVGVVACLILRGNPEDRIRRDLDAADDEIQSAFTGARRAMNDAAGQSWRNLAG